MQKLEAKIDKLVETQQEMLIQLTENTKDLKYHIKRTDLLEGKVSKLYQLILLGAGASMVLYGDVIYKYLKVVL